MTRPSICPPRDRFSVALAGLPALRTSLNLEGSPDFTKGVLRSEMAASTFSRSYQYEEEFYNFLISQVAEEYIHEQKRIRPGNINCDFFLYNTHDKSKSIVIDVFFADSLYNLAGVVNIKTRRYKDITFKTFFVSIGEHLAEGEISALMLNKKIKLPHNIRVCSETWFKQNISSIIVT